jgi:hypothetical protein
MSERGLMSRLAGRVNHGTEWQGVATRSAAAQLFNARDKYHMCSMHTMSANNTCFGRMEIGNTESWRHECLDLAVLNPPRPDELGALSSPSILLGGQWPLLT